MMYILAWIEHLGDDYRSIIKRYADEVNVLVPSMEKFCATQTWNLYGFPIMMAMYARQNNGQVRIK
ncbi:hypothetical protein OESDEN_22298 [Oesophagostomum dentatum]|uniref:Uncharacterized protein n=1 Tax=Oesophagostomum dentatum TaxID=61180 RepID=A0A0B1S3P3_OESDE|nr:hypothetical protein OESDEN_22298 [Oesophagostomum dentatum]